MNETLQALLLTGAVLGFIGRYVVINFLRSHHIEDWEALGRPGDLFGDSRTDWRFLKYILFGRYKSLGDRRFAIICHIYRAYSIVYIGAFVSFLILLLYVLLIHRNA